MIKSSIEISSKGEIFCDTLSISDVSNFLQLFSFYAQREQYNYIQMKAGMVQPMNKEIVISFGIIIDSTSFRIVNVLSSMDFEETKKFIANILN